MFSRFAQAVSDLEERLLELVEIPIEEFVEALHPGQHKPYFEGGTLLFPEFLSSPRFSYFNSLLYIKAGR